MVKLYFLNDNQYFYVYLYWGKCPLGHIRPLPLQIITQNLFLIFFILFFHFRCILLQISHKIFFFISISILGRSGVNIYSANLKMTWQMINDSLNLHNEKGVSTGVPLIMTKLPIQNKLQKHLAIMVLILVWQTN